MNILEGSGVFAAYQLQTNYRSNQEILDFANVTLKNIEANQYANIQLRANNISAKVTEQSFTDRVILDYHKFQRIRDFNEALGGFIAKDVKGYIDAKLAAGEQVAFLAYSRNHVNLVESALKTLYPDKKIANLIPEKMYNSTVFSTFIKKYWNEIQFVPSRKVMYTIGNAVTNKLDNIVYDAKAALESVRKLLQSWYDEEGTTIENWQVQHLTGVITLDKMFDNIKENMLQFEIRHNAIKQALLSARNEENKKEQNAKDANFVLSTIHSAKGLEFDNVVVVYRASNLISEEDKRMYYVALTRAMKSEYVLAYGTLVDPKITGDYANIVKTLHENKNPQDAPAPAPDANTDSATDTARYIANIKKKADALEKEKRKSSKK